MFATQLQSAVAGAATLTQLDHLSRDLWKAHAAGVIADTEAEEFAELIYARRGATRASQTPVGIPRGRCTIFRPRRLQRPPERLKALERRRTLAASGPLPPRLAGRFTTGCMAVLRVIADGAKGNGSQCIKSVAEIAARAGVCHRLAQYALRLAEREGLLTVQERRQKGRPNLANIVRIICAEWLDWLRGKRGKTGCKKLRSTTNKFSKRPKRSERVGWSNPLRPILGDRDEAEHRPRGG